MKRWTQPALGTILLLFLIPDAMAGKLYVSSEPKGAEIVIDGRDTGKETPSLFELATRKVQVSLKLKETFVGKYGTPKTFKVEVRRLEGNRLLAAGTVELKR